MPRKLGALIGAWFFRIPKIDSESPAVLLFTSGSESLPKAVPLTHTNIITNIIGALSHFPLTTEDILIGFLPPFHSFGFTINTIMPLLSGLRVAYTPNPSDSKAIANIIAHCSATTLTATPTFLKMVLAASTLESLQALRYGVVGAEKCPESLFESFAKLCPEGKILEGYGITECSPVISINPAKLPKKGSVGLPIESLETLILSLDGKARMETGKEGMIYVRGPSVFSGYLDASIENPFEEIYVD
jgi:acyl-CoA synthetase (AMP-forming)/AMP-acid ligase II